MSERTLLHVLGLVVIVEIAALAAMYVNGIWLHDAMGRVVKADFVGIWSAGSLARHGAAAAIYDPASLKAAEDVVAPGSPGTYMAWHYPPWLLFAAEPVSLLPLFAGYWTWVLASVAVFAAVVWLITRRLSVLLLLVSAPASLYCVIPGQNGFLSAALVGYGLLMLERRPRLSGIAFGLMTYKPQLGLVIPFVLLFGRRWETIAAAVLTAAALSLASLAAFGAAPWIAFLQSMHASVAEMQAGVGWDSGVSQTARLQSAYAIARSFGAGDAAAWTAQILVSAALIALSVWTCRRAVSRDLKAATVAAASLLAAPYSFFYDAPLLLMATAFLIADALTAGWRRWDRPVIAASILLPSVPPILGSLATTCVFCLVIALILRRRAPPGQDSAPPPAILTQPLVE